MPVTGEGRRGVLVVAEAPGEEEDARGVQLVGNAGRVLRDALRDVGVDLDRDCWKTNALICRPEDNRTPTVAEIGYCRPNVIRAIRELQPRVVLLLGDAAVKSVIGWLWKSDTGPISRWVGYQIPCQEINAWICPAYHPQYVSYEENNKAVRLIFERDAQAAFLTQGRPEPIQQPRVDLERSPRAAAAFLREVVRRGGALTIDYETNRLKPDSENARIVCAAVNWQGKRVLAFPWHGEAIEVWRDLIWSPHPKIAANMKFEQRWSRRFFGRGVRNWVWDTMQAGHVIDNRHGVTSVKFQAFAMLGESAYDDHIEQFLQDSDERGVNNIQDIEIGQLLQYCADDVRVEWQIAEKQTRLPWEVLSDDEFRYSSICV